jgi:predicted nucleotidyltransferase
MTNESNKFSHNFQKVTQLLLKKHGIIKAGVFGSYARGDMGNTSDIDLVVQFKKGKSLLDLVALKEEIEKKIKKPVDIITYNSLHPLLKEKILKEHQLLYEQGS